jgi:hypothetical protein
MGGVALEHAGEVAADLDRGGETLWVHLLGRGHPEEIDALGLRQPGVPLLVPRVGVQILAWTELRRVDEQADYHDV